MTKKKVMESRKDHGNSTWSTDKWELFLKLTEQDVDQDKSCANAGIPVSTLHDWLKRDEELSEEYDRAKTYMDAKTSSVISVAMDSKDINELDRAKLAMDWKKRRDKRYSDKIDGTQDVNLATKVVLLPPMKEDAGCSTTTEPVTAD